jgi:hypothetical protein
MVGYVCASTIAVVGAPSGTLPRLTTHEAQQAGYDGGALAVFSNKHVGGAKAFSLRARGDV